MKKLLLPFLVFLFATACKKEVSSNLMLSEEIASKSAKNKKIDVCHYDAFTGKSKTISISENALKAHLDHGDMLGDCSAVITTICDQQWMVKNLDVTTYRNGDPIHQVTDEIEWANLTTGAWCYYSNNTANGITYGKLYNWYAVIDPRGLAPVGWHIPSEVEWETLNTCLGNDAAGGKMKSVGTIQAGTGLWLSPNVGATNSSGFSGHPGGDRTGQGGFESIGIFGIWWTTNLLELGMPEARYLAYFAPHLLGSAFRYNSGLSVRCVRD